MAHRLTALKTGKAGPEWVLAGSHTAQAKTRAKLRRLMCVSGERSDGDACVRCESPCEYGLEYLRVKGD